MIRIFKIVVLLFVFNVKGFAQNEQEYMPYSKHLVSMNYLGGKYGIRTLTDVGPITDYGLRGFGLNYTYRLKPRIGFQFDMTFAKSKQFSEFKTRQYVFGIKLTTKASKRLQFFLIPQVGIGRYKNGNVKTTSVPPTVINSYDNDYRSINIGFSLGFDVHIGPCYLTYQMNTRTSMNNLSGFWYSSIGVGYKF